MKIKFRSFFFRKKLLKVNPLSLNIIHSVALKNRIIKNYELSDMAFMVFVGFEYILRFLLYVFHLL